MDKSPANGRAVLTKVNLKQPIRIHVAGLLEEEGEPREVEDIKKQKKPCGI